VSEAPTNQPSGNGPSGPRASFGRRLVAFIIDSVIIGIAYGIVYALVGQAVAGLVTLVVAIAYFVYFEGGPTGQTLGKRALGIRVYDFRQGGPIGYGRGFIRYIGKVLSSIPCYLGYFWMLWDREKQAWDDKLANSVVVPVADYPVER
jgi:uncharacterized RDD family membrane protein YckC